MLKLKQFPIKSFYLLERLWFILPFFFIKEGFIYMTICVGPGMVAHTLISVLEGQKQANLCLEICGRPGLQRVPG